MHVYSVLYKRTQNQSFTKPRFIESDSGERVLLNWIECDVWAQAGYSPNESHPKREEVRIKSRVATVKGLQPSSLWYPIQTINLSRPHLFLD